MNEGPKAGFHHEVISSGFILLGSADTCRRSAGITPNCWMALKNVKAGAHLAASDLFLQVQVCVRYPQALTPMLEFCCSNGNNSVGRLSGWSRPSPYASPAPQTRSRVPLPRGTLHKFCVHDLVTGDSRPCQRRRKIRRGRILGRAPTVARMARTQLRSSSSHSWRPCGSHRRRGRSRRCSRDWHKTSGRVAVRDRHQ